jgi:hypothetical protein
MLAPLGDRLDILATLVQAYEAKHYRIEPPDPIEAIKFRMEQGGLSIKDLEPLIGKSNRVYEVLGRTRPLTLPMIRRQRSCADAHPSARASDHAYAVAFEQQSRREMLNRAAESQYGTKIAACA